MDKERKKYEHEIKETKKMMELKEERMEEMELVIKELRGVLMALDK